jgi:hypothetical protein
MLQKFKFEVDRHWYTNDKLDLFKEFLGFELVGLAKQLNEYRGWIAHGKKEDRRHSVIIPPDVVYNIIMRIIFSITKEQLELNKNQ